MIAMTVYLNDGRTSEGTVLLDDWAISDSELLSALSDQDRTKLVSNHNNVAEDHSNVNQVETAQELTSCNTPVRDMIEHDLRRNLCDVALKALDNRETEYIVHVDKTSPVNFYTVTVMPE